MKKTRTPDLPPAVAARMTKRIFIRAEVIGVQSPLDRFLRSVRTGQIPDGDDLRIVARQLELVLAGKTFGRAFGLQNGQGRKPNREVTAKNQNICAEVEELRKEGSTLEAAAELVAQRYQCSSESVSKLHKSEQKRKRARESSERLRQLEGRGKN